MENCSYCNSNLNKTTSEINRSKKEGRKLFCNKTCFALSRKKNESPGIKKERKRLYDINYRGNNKDKICTDKKLYNETKSGRETQKRNRYKFKEYHSEYCKTDKYKSYKKDYDKYYRAKDRYGEYYESFLLIIEIEKEYEKKDTRLQLNLVNKSQKRKRNYEKTQCKKP